MRSRSRLWDTGEEPLLPRRARSGEEGDLDITPMIDVTFLLLIFFMVTSHMQPVDATDLPIARYGVGVEDRQALSVKVSLDRSASASGTPRIETDRRQITLTELRQQVADSVAHDRRKVIIKAERQVPHGFVQEVMRTVTSVEGVEFFVGVEEKP